MIKLENIVRKGNLISAHVVSIEFEPDIFDITVDIEKEEIVELSKERQDMYTSMAMAKLLEIANKYSASNTPKTAVSACF